MLRLLKEPPHASRDGCLWARPTSLVYRKPFDVQIQIVIRPQAHNALRPHTLGIGGIDSLPVDLRLLSVPPLDEVSPVVPHQEIGVFPVLSGQSLAAKDQPVPLRVLAAMDVTRPGQNLAAAKVISSRWRSIEGAVRR